MRCYRLGIRGVIHVGAHAGQEQSEYASCGINRQIWIEPQPEIFERLVEAVGPGDGPAAAVRCFNVACGPKPGTAQLHRLDGNDGMSNSLLEPKGHLERWPQFAPDGTVDVSVVRLDDLLKAEGIAAKDHNLLVLDVQGYEQACLQGAEQTLDEVEYLITEVAAAELFEGGVLVDELDQFLGKHGFVRVETKWAAGCAGDALYVKRTRLTALMRLRLAVIGGKHARPPMRGSELTVEKTE